jgi:hypothetical protein
LSAMSDYMENKVIDHFLRNTTYTPAATVYVALFTANTGLESNNPSAEVSTSGTAYARVAVTFNAASGGATANSADLTWTTATASWSTVTSMAIVDHATNVTWGTNVNVLMWADLTASKTVASGDTFKILAGDLDVTMA